MEAVTPWRGPPTSVSGCIRLRTEQCRAAPIAWQEQKGRRDLQPAGASTSPAARRGRRTARSPVSSWVIKLRSCRQRRCSRPARPASGPARLHSLLHGQAGPWRDASRLLATRERVSEPGVWLARPPAGPAPPPAATATAPARPRICARPAQSTDASLARSPPLSVQGVRQSTRRAAGAAPAGSLRCSGTLPPRC